VIKRVVLVLVVVAAAVVVVVVLVVEEEWKRGVIIPFLLLGIHLHQSGLLIITTIANNFNHHTPPKWIKTLSTSNTIRIIIKM